MYLTLVTKCQIKKREEGKLKKEAREMLRYSIAFHFGGCRELMVGYSPLLSGKKVATLATLG